MSLISTFLETILTAVYGKDVRNAMHDAIEQCYSDTSTGKTLAEDAANAASTEALNAATKAALAATAASNADTKAALANTAAGQANTAKSEAQTAATNANVAASAANGVINAAITWGNYAEAKGNLAAAAASNADSKATLAENAASNADAKAALAQSAATVAQNASTEISNALATVNQAVITANEAATLAEETAETIVASINNAAQATADANTAASNADAKALSAQNAASDANTAATNADSKASLALSAASDANTAATNADSKASLALSAATYANNSATNADTKATLAQNAATTANTAATNADAKALLAQNAASTANTAATNADAAIAKMPNIQLLVNADFLNPINQRGVTTISPGSGTAIPVDKWLTARSKITVGANGLVFSWDGINGANAPLFHTIDAAILDRYRGKPCTLSFLINNITYSVPVTIPTVLANAQQFLNVPLFAGVSAEFVYYTSFIYPIYRITLRTTLTEASAITIQGVRLEPGTIATSMTPRLEGQDVVAVKRFYEKLGPIHIKGLANSGFDMTFIYPVEKRSAPTVKVVSANGVTDKISYFNGTAWIDVNPSIVTALDKFGVRVVGVHTSEVVFAFYIISDCELY